VETNDKAQDRSSARGGENLPAVVEQRAIVDRIRTFDHTSLTADVRLSITLEDGSTFWAYRRIRLAKERRRRKFD
jgi:hypothetical protein